MQVGKSKNKTVNKLFQAMRIGLIAVFLIVFLFPQGAAADALGDKQGELSEIQKQLEEQEKALNQKRKEVGTLNGQVGLINGQIRQTKLSIQATQNEIDLAQAEIEKLKAQIKQKEIELAYQKEVLNETIRVIYEETDTNFLEVLFSSDNISEVLDRTEYLGAIEGRIEITMDQITKIKTGLTKDQKNQEEKKVELANKKTDLEAQNAGLAHQRGALANLLTETRGQEALYNKRVELAKQAEQRVSSEIANLIAELSRGGDDYVSQGHVDQGDVVGYQNNTGFSTGSHLHFEVRTNVSHVNPRIYLGSVFIWPLSNFRVTQEYGCTPFARCGDPSGPYRGGPHMGIDLASYDGAPVKAAATGEIIFSRYYGGYGKAVLVYHDNNLFTLYGHMR